VVQLLIALLLAQAPTGAHDRRGWLAPTGVVAPHGALDLDARLMFVHATFALWDRLELGAGGLLPGNGEKGRLYTLAGKLSALSGERGGLALAGELYTLGTPVDWRHWVGLLGPAGSFCLGEQCGMLVSGFWAPAVVDGQVATWRTGALSLLGRVTPGATVVLEMDLGIDQVEPPIRSPLLWYGLRLGRQRLLFDVGMYVGTDYFFGAPWFALSYRARAGRSAERPAAPVDDSSYYLAALRQGFTYELGLGVGHARAIQGYDPGRQLDAPGWAPFALGAGLFLTPRFALGVRATSLVFRHDPGNGRRSYLSVVTALTAESWLHDRLAVAGGLGVGVLGTAPYEANLSRGVAGSFRVSYGLRRLGAGMLKASWELQANVFLNYEVAMGSMLLVQWQRF
jgi:hypothetical protein